MSPSQRSTTKPSASSSSSSNNASTNAGVSKPTTISPRPTRTYALRPRTRLSFTANKSEGPLLPSTSSLPIIPLGHSRTEINRIFRKSKSVQDTVRAEIKPMPTEDVMKYTVATTVNGTYEKRLIRDFTSLGRFFRNSAFYSETTKLVKAAGIKDKHDVQAHTVIAVAAKEIYDMQMKVEQRVSGVVKNNKPFNAAEAKRKRDKFDLLVPFWAGVVVGLNLEPKKGDVKVVDPPAWMKKEMSGVNALKNSTSTTAAAGCVVQ